MKNGGRPKPAPVKPTLAKGTEARVPTAADLSPQPHWTGCPAGCPPSYHEHEPIRIGRCNFCLSLDWSARESLADCTSVCPLQAVA